MDEIAKEYDVVVLGTGKFIIIIVITTKSPLPPPPPFSDTITASHSLSSFIRFSLWSLTDTDININTDISLLYNRSDRVYSLWVCGYKYTHTQATLITPAQTNTTIQRYKI